MRFCFLSLLLFLLVLIAVPLIYKNFFAPEIPYSTALTSSDGKTIECRVIGKIGETLTITKGGETRHEIPLSRLTAKDRYFIKFAVADRSAPVAKKTEKPSEPPFVIARRKEIKALREKIDILQKEVDSNALDRALTITKGQQIEGYQKDIRSMELAIERYKWQEK